MTPTSVVFGAGNVGRGFLGQLFSESGYEVVFADVDAALIAAMAARGRYTIQLVDNDLHEEVTIAPVRGLLATDTEAVAEAVAAANVAATIVPYALGNAPIYDTLRHRLPQATASTGSAPVPSPASASQATA